MSSETLSNEFEEVLRSFSGDASLDRFRSSYEKLLAEWKRGMDTQHRFVSKVQQLNEAMLQSAIRVASMDKLLEEDTSTIEQLKRDAERAMSAAEAASQREARVTASLERLADENAALQRALAKSVALSEQQQIAPSTAASTAPSAASAGIASSSSTASEGVDLQSQLDATLSRAKEAEHLLSMERERTEELSSTLKARQEKYRLKKAAIAELQRKLSGKEAEEAREAKAHSILEKDFENIKDALNAANQSINALKSMNAEAEVKEDSMEKTLSVLKAQVTAGQREKGEMEYTIKKLTNQGKEAQGDLVTVREQLTHTSRELKLAHDESGRDRASVVKLSARLETERHEVERIQKVLDVEKIKTEHLETELAAMEKVAESEVGRVKAAQRTIGSLDKERTAAEKRVEAEAGKVAEVRLEVVAKISEVASLEGEIKRLLLEASKLRGAMTVMNKDREQLRATLVETERHVKDLKTEVRDRDATIIELDQKVEDSATKLQQSQTIYDKLKREHLEAVKKMGLVDEEIAELKRKANVQTNQILQYKEDIQRKNKALVIDKFEQKSVEKRLEQRVVEVSQLKRLLEAAEKNIVKLDSEMGEMTNQIRRLDAEALGQRRAYDLIVTERDILGTQLIRRNDELALMYEKLSIQSSYLSKGESQFRDRLEDMRLLKMKILDLKRELVIARAAIGVQSEMKHDIVRLESELTLERRRVTKLSQTLEDPMNLHRWRQLAGSDPDKMELRKSIAALQRRLIRKTEEIEERDNALIEKDKMYAELKAMLARQPGPDIVEALSSYQGLLSERTKQLKALASEMQMYQAQVAESKTEVESLTRQLMESKKAYFDLRFKERVATPSSTKEGSATGAFGSAAAASDGGEGLDGGQGAVGKGSETSRNLHVTVSGGGPTTPGGKSHIHKRFMGGGFAVGL